MPHHATARLLSVLIITSMSLSAGAEPAAPLRVVASTTIGSGSVDTIEGVAVGPDGSIYVVGEFGKPVDRDAVGVEPRTLGEAVEARAFAYKGPGNCELPSARYGCGFIAKLNADGKRVLAVTQLAHGAGKFTSVAVNERGIYVTGYGSAGMDRLIAGHKSIVATPDRSHLPVKPYIHRDHYTDDRYDTRRDVRGSPMVLRFDADLATVTAATWLEGWQSIWHVPRPLREDRWQPVHLALLPDGDVVISHDGGYQAPLRPEDSGRTSDHHFFDVPDHLSRLGPDLDARRFHLTHAGPVMDPAKINRHYPHFKWTRPYLGQARTLDMAVDPQRKRLYVAGWVPSQTSGEPWWSPFLHAYDLDGKYLWSVYSPDPMSGGKDRMNGQVSDAAVRSVHVGHDGQLLLTTIGDGGNSVLRFDPRDYTQPASKMRGSVHSFRGRMLFWGTVARVDPDSRELTGGDHVSGFASPDGRATLTAAWSTALVPLGDAHLLGIGRQTTGFRFTDKAWDSSDSGGFLRLFDSEFRLLLSTGVKQANLRDVAAMGRRAVIVGEEALPPGSMQKAADADRADRVRGLVLVVELSEAAE